MDFSQAALIAIAGVLVISASVIRVFLGRVGVPTLVGFIVLGFVIRVLDVHWMLLSDRALAVFDFLATLGIICLLFRVGLESHIGQLRRQLKRAAGVWVSDVTVSGLFGFVVAWGVLGLSVVAALFVAVALTATSVGVTVGVWREAGKLDTPTGALLVDVAELDDVSAVLLIALLLATAPALQSGSGGDVLSSSLITVGVFFVKAVGFAGLCYLFAHFVERHMTAFVRRHSDSYGLTLAVVGTGLVIAALTELLGFSFAIGAFFAGLLYSREPDRVRIDVSFNSIHDFLVPFFFIHIGLAVDPAVLTGALVPASLILVAAVAGKLVGAGLPTMRSAGVWAGLAVGISMGSRAEIAMLIMDRGRRLGDWAVRPETFNAVVLATLVTCIVMPVLTRFILKAEAGGNTQRRHSAQKGSLQRSAT